VAGVILSIWSVEAAIVFGVAANTIGVLLGYALIPRGDDEVPAPEAATTGATPRV
jgi:hypothetical protein